MDMKSGDVPSFTGGFHKFKVKISTNQEKGTWDYFVVLSKGKRHTFIKYLWMKFLFDQLTKEETEIFYSLPEIIHSEFKVQALRACLRIGKKELRKRLENLPLIPEDERISRKTYQGLTGNTRYDLSRRVGKLPKPPKFSGWIRNSSAKDRKSASKGSRIDPPNIILEDFVDEQFDWYLYLTVGTVPSRPLGHVGYHSLNEANKQKQFNLSSLVVGVQKRPPTKLFQVWIEGFSFDND